MTDFKEMRREYAEGILDEGSVAGDPVEQFRAWFHEAVTSGLREPNAMSLATVDAAGLPQCRVVLLKEYGAEGFTFYTNYRSQKGLDLAATPAAALLFYWAELERQVRILGPVTRVSREESEAYFRGRPRGSRLSAALSPQSEVIANRAWLEERAREMAEQFPEPADVPLPAGWGGYRVRPQQFEFWQGRADRLHDRIRYREDAGAWVIERLAP